jgi:hypothetical protein
VFSRAISSYSANWVVDDPMLQGSSAFWVPTGLRTLMLEAHGTALVSLPHSQSSPCPMHTFQTNRGTSFI